MNKQQSVWQRIKSLYPDNNHLHIALDINKSAQDSLLELSRHHKGKCIYCNLASDHEKLPASFAPHARKLGLLPCDYVHDDSAPQNKEPMTLGERLRWILKASNCYPLEAD